MSEEVVPLTVTDPLSPDAPIEHLLSIRHNPLVKDMSPDQLRELIQRLRTYAQSAPTLSAKLQSDSDNVNPKKRETISAKRKAILADL